VRIGDRPPEVLLYLHPDAAPPRVRSGLRVVAVAGAVAVAAAPPRVSWLRLVVVAEADTVAVAVCFTVTAAECLRAGADSAADEG
jgi:hypothetical protein